MVDLPKELTPIAVLPGDLEYPSLTSTFFRGGSPAVILRPRDAAEVTASIAYARSSGLKLSVRSGGHGISGRSTNQGGIVIDLGRMRSVEVIDEDARIVKVQPGATWYEVNEAISERGWAISSGDYGGVGVGGLATAGGVGWLIRKHGLTIDNVVAAEVALADGRRVRADKDTEPDLFWAVRGAGAAFGIVTSFEIRAQPVAMVGHAELVLDALDPEALLVAWGAAQEKAPREVTTNLIFSKTTDGRPVAVIGAVVLEDDAERILAVLEPFATIAPLLSHDIKKVPYLSVIDNIHPGGHRGQGEPHVRSSLVDHMTPELARDLVALLDNPEVYFIQLRVTGGAAGDIAPSDTPFADRSANFMPSAIGTSSQGLETAWAPIRKHSSGLYFSFNTDSGPERLDEAFPGETLPRLRRIKAAYDPGNLFNDNLNLL